jgi:hypothetical protein
MALATLTPAITRLRPVTDTAAMSLAAESVTSAAGE